MITYETYKILHLFSLLVVVCAMGVILGEGRWIPDRRFKGIITLGTILLFVGGMGLIARLGFKHGEPFPLWIWIKMVSWLILSVLLILLFRMQGKKNKLLIGSASIVVLFIAVFSAVMKLV